MRSSLPLWLFRNMHSGAVVTSYLGEPFDHDLFVSYSHGSIPGLDGSNLRKCSQALVRELEIELRSDPKCSALRLFLDQDHRPDQGVDPLAPLTDHLRAEIGRAGILTILMSPHYLLSKWCQDELSWWLECQADHDLAAAGRIALARIWLTEDEWPEALLDGRGHELPGFWFHDKTRPQPFGWPDVIEGDRAFREALIGMVGVLWNALCKLKSELDERRRRREAADKLAADAGQLVYLHARPTQARQFEKLGSALEDHGFVVLPTEPDPVEHDPCKVREIAALRIETLASASAPAIAAPHCSATEPK